MPDPVWKRVRVIVDVDVKATDDRGNSFFVGYVEAARLSVLGALGFADNPADKRFDGDGEYQKEWHGQIKIRVPRVEEPK